MTTCAKNWHFGLPFVSNLRHSDVIVVYQSWFAGSASSDPDVDGHEHLCFCCDQQLMAMMLVL